MDLYALLGLVETASGADIERAYRRLARRYHPGVNPGDRLAEQRYQQIQEAYRVLTDAERRRAYDRGGAPAPEPRIEASVAFEGFDFSTPAEGPLAATFSELFADVFRQAADDATASTRGGDIELTVRVPFEDAMRGAEVPISITRQDRCISCGGAGHLARAETVCPVCQGEGMRRWARGHMVFSKPCDGCGGEGRLTRVPCRACRALGVAAHHQVVTFVVPAGIESGARLSVPGRGHAGALGGPAGDLYVTVEVAEHPYFRRQGADLHVTLPLQVHEAALGAVVDVPTLSGTVKMRVPPGTPSGAWLRLREHGVGAGAGAGMGSGDLVVETLIVLPPALDQKSRELLREFGRRNDLDVRRQWFERQ